MAEITIEQDLEHDIDIVDYSPNIIQLTNNNGGILFVEKSAIPDLITALQQTLNKEK